MSHTFHRYRIGSEPVPGYRLTDHLGAGGFGEVWKAEAPGGTEVALKIIDLTGQQGVQEFASLRVVKKVRHPNLISLQAFWMKDEEGQIIDEGGHQQQAPPATPIDVTMVPGDLARQTQPESIAMTTNFARPVELIIAMQLGAMSLHKRLEECREQGLPGVPVAELLEYLEQAARGIDFLNKPIHDLGKGPVPIVHGDIKPHNILVIGDAAVVCDFGLARAVETLRKTSMAPVTVAYAAPESFKGKVTPQTDQYSLAITYAELRTGRLPFDEGMTPYQVMEAHVTRMLDFARLPEPEKNVILRATDPTPEARWPSSRDLILALRQAVASTGELPLRPGEVAFTGGATSSHSLTHRHMLHDTGMPTRSPVDPHKDTSMHAGMTPSQLVSQRTDARPGEPYRPGDPLAETMMPQAAPPAKRSSRGRLAAVGLFVVAGAVAAAIYVPKLIEQNKPPVPSTVSTASTTPTPSAATVASTTPSTPPGSAPDSPPPSTPPAEQPTAPLDANAEYIQLVQGKINDREFATAVDLLDKAPSKLPEFEKEALQKRLKSAFVTFLDSQVQRRAFGRALVELEEAPAGIGLTDDDRQKQRDKVLGLWLAQAQEELQNEQFSRAMESAANLLKRYPDDRAAQMIVARCQVRTGNNAAAIVQLNKLGKTSDQPAEFQPLHAGLLLLATGLESSGPDSAKLLDGFVAFAVLEKDTSPPASLALSQWERGRLEGIRGRVVENVRQQLASLSSDQAKPLLDKLEKLDSSPELQLYKIKSALEQKNYAEARDTLKKVAASIPASDTALTAELAGTGLLIDLLDPKTKPANFTKIVDDANKSLANLKPALRVELCDAAAALALGAQPALLEPAIQLNAKTHDIDPLDHATTNRLARLLAARLALKVQQPKAPGKDELPQIMADCEQVEAAAASTGLTDALHAEALLLTSSTDRQLVSSLSDRAKTDDGYADFVRARVLQTRPQADWNQIAQLLTKAYSNRAKLPPALAAPFRRAEAANLLIQAASKKRAPPAPANPASMLGNPFATPAAADEAFKLLQLATTLANDLDSAGLKLAAASQRELSTNLGLAAAWKARPDEAMARAQTVPLLKSSDSELGSDAFPLLLAAFNAARASDAPTAIQAARRFTELFQSKFGVADLQAVEVYKQVLEPALAIAEKGGRSPPADLDKFYAVAADFVSHYKRAAWPFADKQAEVEKLLTKAIGLNPKVAKYYTSRGAARISLTPPNIDGALADATAASKIDANLPAAFSLQGHALIYRSRQDPTREGRLKHLNDALSKVSTAVEKSKTDDTQRPTYLLYVSMAHLEKASFETDPKLQREHLGHAVSYAQQAVDTEQAYPDYAYVALGNALEDLAWLVNDEPEKNYAAAIDAFSRAIESNLASADPWVGRARCFYKAIADTKIDPQALGRTRDEAFQSAISDLQQANQLNANLVEPQLWLGKAYRQLNKLAEADAALEAAVKLAEEQKLPERALYLIEWTRNASANTALAPEQRGAVVRERAARLKAAPNLGGTSSVKQAAVLVGESLVAERKFTEALKEYDAALADYDKPDAPKTLDPDKADGADVSLFLARAYSRLNVPETQWNLPAAEAVIKDATRIGQLKPAPRFEALANWYAANARSRSLRSTSPTITPQHKLAFLDGALIDVRKAIELAPADPGSWEWRSFGARLVGTKITQTTDAATLKKYSTEARAWIDDAIAQAAKRPDLSAQLERLQRVQQELDTILTGKGLPRT